MDQDLEVEAPRVVEGSEEAQWHRLVDALYHFDTAQRERIIMGLPQHCRHQFLVEASRQLRATEAHGSGSVEEENGAEATSEEEQELDSRGRASVGLDQAAQRPTSEETQTSSPTAAAGGAAEATTPSATDKKEKEKEKEKEKKEKKNWLVAWTEGQRGSWSRVRHPLKQTLGPIWRSLFPSPRTYDYGIETPFSCVHKVSLVPLFNSPWPAPVWKAAWAWLGAFAGIALVGLVAQYALPSDVPSFFAAEGAAATLIFALPDLPTAQPRNMVGGGAISALCAVAFQKAFASTSLTWLAGALSVATAVALMDITGTMNPPGGALALLYIVTPSLHTLGWWYIGVAIMNVLFLIVVGMIVNNIPRTTKYPTYWV